MVANMVRECTKIVSSHTKEPLIMINSIRMVCQSSVPETHTKEIFKTDTNMEKVYIHGKMDHTMKATIDLI